MTKSQQRKLISLVVTILIAVLTAYFAKSAPSQPSPKTTTEAKTISITPISGYDTVKRVIDGDTIQLASGDKVRLIGINTPETHHPTKPVECFGPEAEAFNRKLEEGKQVRLEKDVSNTDKYGRLLRYVYLVPQSTQEAEIFVNKVLVEEGYALADTFPPDVKYQDIFLQAQRTAREQNKGLWASCKLQ